MADTPLVQFHNVSFSITVGPPLRGRPSRWGTTGGHGGPPLQIISDLNLAVEKGETLVLLGESGCGKTTTLKLVNRLLTPTSGDVFVEGKPTTAWDPIAL